MVDAFRIKGPVLPLGEQQRPVRGPHARVRLGVEGQPIACHPQGDHGGAAESRPAPYPRQRHHGSHEGPAGRDHARRGQAGGDGGRPQAGHRRGNVRLPARIQLDVLPGPG